MSGRDSSGSDQRRKSAGGPDRHRHGEQDRGGGAASEADGSACEPDRRRHTFWALRACLHACLRYVFVRSDASPPNQSHATSLQAVLKARHLGLRNRGAQRGPIAWRLYNTCAEVAPTILVNTFPPEVPGHGSPTSRVLESHSKSFDLCVEGLLGLQGVADALKLVRDTGEMIADDLECILETRDVGRWVVAHAAHNTRRAA